MGLVHGEREYDITPFSFATAYPMFLPAQRDILWRAACTESAKVSRTCNFFGLTSELTSSNQLGIPYPSLSGSQRFLALARQRGRESATRL